MASPGLPLPFPAMSPCHASLSDRLPHHGSDQVVSSRPGEHVHVYQLWEWVSLIVSVRNHRRCGPAGHGPPHSSSGVVSSQAGQVATPLFGGWGEGHGEPRSRVSPIGTIRSSFPAENAAFRGSIARSGGMGQ